MITNAEALRNSMAYLDTTAGIEARYTANGLLKELDHELQNLCISNKFGVDTLRFTISADINNIAMVMAVMREELTRNGYTARWGGHCGIRAMEIFWYETSDDKSCHVVREITLRGDYLIKSEEPIRKSGRYAWCHGKDMTRENMADIITDLAVEGATEDELIQAIAESKKIMDSDISKSRE